MKWNEIVVQLNTFRYTFSQTNIFPQIEANKALNKLAARLVLKYKLAFSTPCKLVIGDFFRWSSASACSVSYIDDCSKNIILSIAF